MGNCLGESLYMYKHAISNKLDFFNSYDFNRFVDEYLDVSQLSVSQKKALQKHLNNYLIS